MSVFVFFLGVLIGVGVTVAVAACWMERHQAAHFEQLLNQIKSLGPSA